MIKTSIIIVVTILVIAYIVSGLCVNGLKFWKQKPHHRPHDIYFKGLNIPMPKKRKP